jgi:DNA-binding NarL/FixJ family response regulator
MISSMIRLAILEDDALVRDMLAAFLVRQSDLECLFAAGSVPEFFEQADALSAAGGPSPDIVLTDIGLPGTNGIEAIPLIRKRFAEASVMIFSIYADNDRIFKALCAGAVGYLQKDAPLDEVVAAVRLIHKGGSAMSPAIARKVMEYFAPRKTFHDPLTAKEQQVVMAMVDGLSYKMIADRLGISLETVRQHIKHIYRKLHVNSKGEVIAKSIRGEI